MGEARHDGLAVPGRVILAHELPFRIGQTFVHPATRQIERGDRRETLEPRVMQALVALEHAKGRIVTRDELIDACWEGRVVGDDSINRVLSRIRRVAADLGCGDFAVQTIARVGYRLTPASDNHEPAVSSQEAGTDRQLDRRLFFGGALALSSVAAVGTLAWWPGSAGRGAPSPKAKELVDQAEVIRHEDNRQALAYLREAVRISPDYGEAWGALAISYRTAINNEAPERVAGFEERLKEAVRNAERFDSGNADAAAALLPSVAPFGRWAQLEPIYRSAIRRHPGHAAAYSLLGNLLMDVGRWSDAAGALRSAIARSPSSPVLRYKLIVSLWSAGQISGAEDEIDRAMRLWPQHGAIWQTKIKLLALTGRPKEALALATDSATMPLDEENIGNQQGRLPFLTALATGSTDATDTAIAATVRNARDNEHNRVNMALQSAVLGRSALALDLLEGTYLGTGGWAPRAKRPQGISTHPLFQPHARPLWREPRFNRILATVGLDRYWRISGTVPDYRRRG